MTHDKAILILHGLRSSYICDPNECPLEERDDNHFLCKGCDEHHNALVMAIDAMEDHKKYEELLEIAASEESIKEQMCDSLAHFCGDWCEDHCGYETPDKYCVDKWLEWRMEE